MDFIEKDMENERVRQKIMNDMATAHEASSCLKSLKFLKLMILMFIILQIK